MRKLKSILAATAVAVACMELLCGCMASFDREVDWRHREYTAYRAKHLQNYNQQQLRHDWMANYWWGKYIEDKAKRGKPMCEGWTNAWEMYPTHGVWATCSGRWMIQEIEDVK